MPSVFLRIKAPMYLKCYINIYLHHVFRLVLKCFFLFLVRLATSVRDALLSQSERSYRIDRLLFQWRFTCFDKIYLTCFYFTFVPTFVPPLRVFVQDINWHGRFGRVLLGFGCRLVGTRKCCSARDFRMVLTWITCTVRFKQWTTSRLALRVLTPARLRIW